jgi:AbrB family looped-hinge helix DNA binding protein
MLKIIKVRFFLQIRLCGGNMENKDKFIWTTKMTSKGQIVIPKEAREVFGLNEGDTLILLGDKTKGIAIAKYEDYVKFAEQIFKAGGKI